MCNTLATCQCDWLALVTLSAGVHGRVARLRLAAPCHSAARASAHRARRARKRAPCKTLGALCVSERIALSFRHSSQMVCSRLCCRWRRRSCRRCCLHSARRQTGCSRAPNCDNIDVAPSGPQMLLGRLPASAGLFKAGRACLRLYTCPSPAPSPCMSARLDSTRPPGRADKFIMAPIVRQCAPTWRRFSAKRRRKRRRRCPLVAGCSPRLPQKAPVGNNNLMMNYLRVFRCSARCATRRAELPAPVASLRAPESALNHCQRRPARPARSQRRTKQT